MRTGGKVNMKKLLSTLLALLMIVSTFSVLFTSPIYAAEAEGETEDEEIVDEEGLDILKVSYKTPEEKLKTMKKRAENDNFAIYTKDAYGEVALYDKRTGQILFSNPYDIANTKGSDDTKATLMSQIILSFSTGSKTTVFNSYTEAALRDQIVVKNIKNGVRVEYTMGKSEARYLVPQMIENQRFMEKIINPITQSLKESGVSEKEQEFILGKFYGFFTLKDITDPSLTAFVRSSMLESWPILKKLDAIWVIAPEIRDRELNLLEGYIKTYAPEYTYEELDYDHEYVEYEETASTQPLFRMALEYTLDDTGMIQTMAANSLRFDESNYVLNYVKVNPWFGAINSTYEGRTFIPNGSGALVEAKDALPTYTSKVYGSDFAYHESRNDPAHRQTMRLPVYGAVEDYYSKVTTPTIVQLPEEEWYTDAYGYVITTKTEMVTVETTESRGYFAMVLEGDSLTEISSESGANKTTHVYSAVGLTYYPRPSDSYNLSDAISAGADATWSVTSKRKYTGKYKVKYFMLSDEALMEEYKEKAAEENVEVGDMYSADYMGMVNACRDYFEDAGILDRITADEVDDQIPLIIETLGVTDGETRILSIPVSVKVPLTSFEDIESMYATLESQGITNVKFKLTGYTNGGLYSTMPGKLKWEKKAGGKQGFADLMAFANEKGIGIYPDFDFSYVSATSLFDGFSYRKHAVKTMDDRYASKYEYDPAYQMFFRNGQNPISASVFDFFYEKLAPKLLEVAPTGISVGSLGSDLNSDFDEDDPYNREDCKDFVVRLLKDMQEDFGSVMIEGGNAYTLPYVDYILEMPLDSDLSASTSTSIPFMGMVLHGYVNIAGSALNMAGDIDYEILKAIENGASPYFLLAYQNTDELKSDPYYKKYYAVNFKIWAESDIAEIYNVLNEALADVQDKLIIDHEFLEGERVLTEEEIAQREEDEKRREEEESISQSIQDAMTAEDETAGDTAADNTDEGEEAAPSDGETEGEAEQPADTEAETEAETGAETEDGEQTGDGEEDEDAEPEINPEDLVDNCKIVKVTYEGGKTFILNYNNYAVRVDGQEIPALGFIVTAKGGQN